MFGKKEKVKENEIDKKATCWAATNWNEKLVSRSRFNFEGERDKRVGKCWKDRKKYYIVTKNQEEVLEATRREVDIRDGAHFSWPVMCLHVACIAAWNWWPITMSDKSLGSRSCHKQFDTT